VAADRAGHVYVVDAVFGNSMHEFAMLARARDAYAINPNRDLEAKAAELSWNIYWPERK